MPAPCAGGAVDAVSDTCGRYGAGGQHLPALPALAASPGASAGFGPSGPRLVPADRGESWPRPRRRLPAAGCVSGAEAPLPQGSAGPWSFLKAVAARGAALGGTARHGTPLLKEHGEQPEPPPRDLDDLGPRCCGGRHGLGVRIGLAGALSCESQRSELT